MMVVISQPRYLPVISYLQRLAFADAFVLLDIVKRQYAGWENRNKLLLPKPKWLTIPISSSRMEIIKNTRIQGTEWIDAHKRSIFHNYKNHPFFDESLIDSYYGGIKEMIHDGNNLFVDVIEKMIYNVCNLFDFYPKIVRASTFETDNIRQAKGADKLLEICRELGADIYVSGENGCTYGVNEVFHNSNIKVMYHPSNIFRYPQWGQEVFIPYMGFFDALFNVGLTKVKEVVLSPPHLLTPEEMCNKYRMETKDAF